jgi:hypothetical protein
MAIVQNITSLDPVTLEYQDYSIDDTTLISSSVFSSTWSDNKDYIEYYVYNLNGDIIESDLDLQNYLSTKEGLLINPDEDIQNIGFTEGTFNTLYNFYNPLLASSIDVNYYISQISSDRTELKINTNQLTGQQISSGYNALKQVLSTATYYKDFFLNFGDNKLVIANNALIDTSDSNNIGVFIKLYEPLPAEFGIKNKLWVVDKVADSVAYQIELQDDTVFTQTNPFLQGPNFNLKIQDEVNNPTDFLNLSQLTTSPSASLFNQLGNILNKKGIEPNIDYTNYSEFAYFSSIETRIENFYYKLQLIENYEASSSLSTSTPTTPISASSAIYQNLIHDVVEKFDGFERYMYFESSSQAYPKSTSNKPYTLYGTSTSQALDWLAENLTSGSDYDRENVNNLIYTIPDFIREDSNNSNYELFVEMVGQHFDTIWTCIKDVTNKYNRDNRVDYGASRDLIADILRDFGIKIYQNNFSNQDLYNAFLGIGANGNTLPPTGSELITNYITASSDIIPLTEVNEEIYSRLYHNLPTILKKKGTVDALRTIINCYGVPNTVLRISEFGGKDRDNSNDWDYWYNKANYSFTPSGSGGWVEIPWQSSSNADVFPKTVEFRFKSPNLATVTGYSQSLAVTENSTDFAVVIEYTGSLFTSGSYSGSVVNPENTFATIKYINETNNVSASVAMPVFNDTWVSLMVTETSGSTSVYNLYAANKLYTGNDGSQIGFYQSASCTGSTSWKDVGTLQLPYSSSYTYGGKTYQPFTGSFQEVRYYSEVLNTQSFEDYTMNPLSIEGNSLEGSDSSFNSLFFRAPLGAVLDNSGSGNQSRTSVHPSSTGSYASTSSFDIGSSYNISGSYTFSTNEEYIFLDQVVTGIKNRINDKIRIDVQTTASGDTLSPLVRIETNPPQYQTYTRDLTTLEIAFSPQNEINDDIINQLGFFNIGEYLGNPSLLSTTGSNQYPDLERFRNNFFEKYTHNYNLKDYTRLIKYFDNSLFKLLKDFIPARVEASTGLVVKQHLLERNRAPIPLPTYIDETFSGSINIGNVEGGTLGSFNQYNQYAYSPEGQSEGVNPATGSFIMDLTQSFSESFATISGSTPEINSTQAEFYTGEFSGSTVTVTTQSLNPECAIFLDAVDEALQYSPIVFSSTFGNTISQFSSLVPKSGQILILYSGETYENGFQGVQYVKIHKEDINGDDKSPFIESINNLRLLFASNNLYNLPVETISEASTFYTYQISNNSVTSIIDDVTYRKPSNFVTGSITYNLSSTPGPYSSSITSIDQLVSLTGSNAREYNSSDPASSDPPNGQFLVDYDLTHLTTRLEVSNLDSSAINNSSASLNDVSASWTASFISTAPAPTRTILYGVVGKDTGGGGETGFHRYILNFLSTGSVSAPKFSEPTAQNGWDIEFYSQSIDTVLTTGFQPSGLNGEDPTKTYNFNDLGNTTINDSKLGKTLLYFDFPTVGDSTYGRTGSVTASISSDAEGEFIFDTEIDSDSGNTNVTAYKYTNNITSSFGEVNDFSTFNFNFKVNFSGSVTYNNTDMTLEEGYNFQLGISKESSPINYTPVINLPINSTSGSQLTASFNEDVVFGYSLTTSTITDFNPLDNLTFVILDANRVGVGQTAPEGEPTLPERKISSSLDQYFESITITLTASDAAGNLIATQSFSTSSTIVEPYLTQRFFNTDCDVLSGLVDKYVKNKIYLESRYPTIGPQFTVSPSSAFIPQNFTKIVDGTAIRSDVKPYNYSHTPHIRARYNGTKIIASDVNQVSGVSSPIPNNQKLFFDNKLLDINGSIISSKPINTMMVSDRIPIKSLKPLAVLFTNINDAAPEIKNASIVQIDKILIPSIFSITSKNQVDIFGPIQQDSAEVLDVSNYPQLDGFSYAQSDMANNFSYNDFVKVEIFDTEEFESDQRNVVGERQVLKGGKRVDPVLYNEIYDPVLSDSGRGAITVVTRDSTFTSSIPFQRTVPEGTDYNFIARATGSYSFSPTASILVTYNWTTQSKATSGVSAGFNITTDTYTFTGSTTTDVKFSTKITLSGNLTSKNRDSDGSLFTVKLLKNSGSANSETIEKGILKIPSLGATSSIILEQEEFSSFSSGDTVKVVIIPEEVATKPFPNFTINANSDDFFKLTQNGFNAGSVSTASIWTTGSVNSTWLTASIALSDAYGQTPVTIPDSGFSPLIEKFEIKIGDEIRFEGKESTTRIILNVVQSDGYSLRSLDGGPQIQYAPNLRIQLNSPPPSGSNITQFMIRRYTDDAKFILLKGLKPVLGTTSRGFLTPKYPSSALSNFLESPASFSQYFL